MGLKIFKDLGGGLKALACVHPCWKEKGKLVQRIQKYIIPLQIVMSNTFYDSEVYNWLSCLQIFPEENHTSLLLLWATDWLISLFLSEIIHYFLPATDQ